MSTWQWVAKVGGMHFIAMLTIWFEGQAARHLLYAVRWRQRTVVEKSMKNALEAKVEKRPSGLSRRTPGASPEAVPRRSAFADCSPAEVAILFEQVRLLIVPSVVS